VRVKLRLWSQELGPTVLQVELKGSGWSLLQASLQTFKWRFSCCITYVIPYLPFAVNSMLMDALALGAGKAEAASSSTTNDRVQVIIVASPSFAVVYQMPVLM
jgi:hypothetical protein